MPKRPDERLSARRCGAEGYVLVEALATLALSALLLVGMLSLLGVTRLSADRAAQRVQTIEVAGRSLALVAEEIRHAQRRRWAAEEEKARGFVFQGQSDRILFALDAESAGLRAPVVVQYQAPSAGVLLRAEAPLRTDAHGAADIKLGPVARVSTGAERLRFAFLGQDEDGVEAVTDAWLSPARMPKAVLIERTLADGTVAGSLRVPLLVDGDAGCADPKKAFCGRAPKETAPDGAEAAGTAPGAKPR